jgi:hypothetical protein
MDIAKQIFQIRTVRIPVIPALIGSVVAVVLSLFVPILALVVLLAAGSLLFVAAKRFSIIEALLCSFTSLMLAHIVLYSIVTICQLHLPIRFALPIEAALLLAACAWQLRGQAHQTITIHWFRRGDLGALVTAIVTAALLCIPIIQTGGGFIAQFLSYGEDNASHYALARYITEAGDLAYQHEPDDVGLIQSLEIYPQGFHLNAAIFAGLTTPNQLSEGGFIKLYSLFITLQFSLFIFWFAKVVLLARQHTSRVISIAFVPAITLLAGLGLLLLMLYRGFQPQIFAYVFLMLIVWLLGLASQQSTDKQRWYIYAAVCMCIGIAASWWILLPVVGLQLLVIVYRFRLWVPLYTDLRRHVALKITVVFAILYPVAINMLFSLKQDPLNEPGGVDKLTWTVFWYLAPIIVGAFIGAYRTMRKYDYVTIALGAAIIVALGIGIYHKLAVGHFEYYFYKSIYTVLILAFALALIGGIALAQRAYDALRDRRRFIIPVVVLALTITIACWSTMAHIRVYVHNWLPNAVQRGDMDVLFTPEAAHYKDVLFVGGCSPARDYLRNRWSGARYLADSTTRSAILRATMAGDMPALNTRLPAYAARVQPLLVITSADCSAALPAIQTIRSLPGVTVQNTL